MDEFTTGTTIRGTGTFKDINTDALADPNLVTAKGYDSDRNELFTNTANVVRVSLGVFYYDWILPTIEGNYYLELHGDMGSEPVIRRIKFKAKFRIE